MLLFDVPAGKRVRITSRLIRWVERGSVRTIAENITWEGTTTDRYFFYKGAQRRLLVDHTAGFWQEYGIWQRNARCDIVG